MPYDLFVTTSPAPPAGELESSQTVWQFWGHWPRLFLEMWRRRHAPHITGNYPGYCMAMVKGLIRQWVIARERSPEVPWNEDLDTRAVA